MSFEKSRPVVVWLKGDQRVWEVDQPGVIIGMRVYCGGCGVIAEDTFRIRLEPGDTARFKINRGHHPWKPGSRAVAYYLDDGVGGGEGAELEDAVGVTITRAPRELVHA